MENKVTKLWKIILGVVGASGAVVALATGVFQLKRDVVEVRATPTLEPTPVFTNTPVPTPTPLFTPGPLTFIEKPDEVHAGTDVKVVVQAWEGATCYLEYHTTTGKSDVEDLGITTPDGMGYCIWEWRVNGNTKPGEGKLIIRVGDFEESHPLMILPPK